MTEVIDRIMPVLIQPSDDETEFARIASIMRTGVDPMTALSPLPPAYSIDGQRPSELLIIGAFNAISAFDAQQKRAQSCIKRLFNSEAIGSPFELMQKTKKVLGIAALAAVIELKTGDNEELRAYDRDLTGTEVYDYNMMRLFALADGAYSFPKTSVTLQSKKKTDTQDTSAVPASSSVA